MLMSLDDFLEQATQNAPVSFADTMAIIGGHYHYQPTAFSNGLGEGALINPAGANEGSCKIFAFAKLHQLDARATLNLFGDYYRLDVLNDPEGSGHQNIRNFMKYGWEGIVFEGCALMIKTL